MERKNLVYSSGKDFLDLVLKQTTNANIGKWDCIELKTEAQKKKQPKEWKIANHTFNMLIIKEHIQARQTVTRKQLKIIKGSG